MAFLDHKGESEFPFAKDIVFDAMCKAIPTIKGLSIHSADKLLGRILVKGDVSLFSWGENVPVQLTQVDENRTKVIINSSPKTGVLLGGAFDAGKNNKNIEQILSATSNVLQFEQTPTPLNIIPPPINNVENREHTKATDSNQATEKSKWYDNKFITHLLLILFFPIGLYALWKSRTIAKWWKVTATILIAFIVIKAMNDDGNTTVINEVTNDNRKQQTISNEEEHKPEVSEEKKIAIGETTEVGNFIYKVEKTTFKKTIWDDYYGQTADGIYLLVTLSIKNISNESRTLDNSLFKLTDNNGTTYESSNDGTTALELSGGNSLLLKQCQPNITTKGTLVFEVPNKNSYNLHLSGGFWEGSTAVITIN